MSNQVNRSCVHQIDTDSNLLPVLGLRPHSKSTKVHKGQQKVPKDLCGGVKSQGAVTVRLAEFIRPKQTKTWPHAKRALHRNSGFSRACEGKRPLI